MRARTWLLAAGCALAACHDAARSGQTAAASPPPAAAATATASVAMPCVLLRRQDFAPQHKPVGLAAGPAGGDAGRIVVFSTPLRVNTDGAPNSYHPDDPGGTRLAINNIQNGIAIRGPGGGLLRGQAAVAAFAAFRDGDWHAPPGLSVAWENVLAARQEGGRRIPCVFRSGENAGYFGSLTALKNGLADAQAGECLAANQLDERLVPALVMAGGQNPVRGFGGRLGDLVVAHNPANGATEAAVIGDTGPPENLGEGSVALNMGLLARDEQPKTYTQAKRLDTGAQAIEVAVLPGTRVFSPALPYSRENIRARVAAWAAANGYGSLDGLVTHVNACAAKLRG